MMVNIEVNGLPVSVVSGSTVLQACEKAGYEIPRFCYEPRLLIAGNCRMCLVEVAGSPKPQASCALPVTPNMKVFTDSPRVKKAREMVMEFLLANHPLDCPICDQGGECDRQDQSMAYGSDRSRFFETKRSVQDKDLGPLVATVMTRCIHCTRCIRFASEIAGVPVLGTSGRGSHTEVGTYIDKYFGSELSGNVTDLCPVGALTSRPSAYTMRAWEPRPIDTYDTSDGLLSPVRVHLRGQQVMRVLPVDDGVMEGLIGDKARYRIDALEDSIAYGRLSSPVVPSYDAASGVSSYYKPDETLDIKARMSAFAGMDAEIVVSPSVSFEMLSCLKTWRDEMKGRVRLSVLGSSSDLTSVEAVKDLKLASEDLLSVECVSNADVVLLVGLDPRTDAPLRNMKLRQSFLRDRVRVYSVGEQLDLTYPVMQLGNSPRVIYDILSGEHPVAAELYSASRPVIVVGPSVLSRSDSSSRMDALRLLSSMVRSSITLEGRKDLVVKDWKVLNVYHPAASSTAAMALGLDRFVGFGQHSQPMSRPTVLMTVGVDAKELSDYGYGWSKEAGLALASRYSYVVSFSTHFEPLVAYMSNLVLPRPTGFEDASLYMKTTGQVVETKLASGLLRDHVRGYDVLMALWGLYGDDAYANVMDAIKSPHYARTFMPLVPNASESGVHQSVSPVTLLTLDRPLRPHTHHYHNEGCPLARHSVTLQECYGYDVSAGDFGDNGFTASDEAVSA